MMNGVEILNTVEKINAGTVVLFVISALASIFFIVSTIWAFKSEDRFFAVGLSIYALVFITLVILCLFVPKNVRHEVTISEEVKFVEFNEQYKIIKQDGKIFTVEERK